jgi:hypothetical protein
MKKSIVRRSAANEVLKNPGSHCAIPQGQLESQAVQIGRLQLFHIITCGRVRISRSNSARARIGAGLTPQLTTQKASPIPGALGAPLWGLSARMMRGARHTRCEHNTPVKNTPEPRDCILKMYVPSTRFSSIFDLQTLLLCQPQTRKMKCRQAVVLSPRLDLCSIVREHGTLGQRSPNRPEHFVASPERRSGRR